MKRLIEGEAGRDGTLRQATSEDGCHPEEVDDPLSSLSRLKGTIALHIGNEHDNIIVARQLTLATG